MKQIVGRLVSSRRMWFLPPYTNRSSVYSCGYRTDCNPLPFVMTSPNTNPVLTFHQMAGTPLKLKEFLTLLKTQNGLLEVNLTLKRI